MNKEEKIGMYTRNEIFEHLCENSDIGMLGRSMYDAVMSKIDNLQSQLATYKEKEYKLREYLSNTEFEERSAYDKSFCEGVYNTKEKALKILNEGDK